MLGIIRNIDENLIMMHSVAEFTGRYSAGDAVHMSSYNRPRQSHHCREPAFRALHRQFSVTGMDDALHAAQPQPVPYLIAPVGLGARQFIGALCL